jgi:hypothetical protein
MKAKEFIKEFRDIDPADDPNFGMDKEFKQDSVFNQLGKILDSRGNPNPLDTVVTDDGKKFKVNFQQATVLRRLLTAPSVKPQIKSQFTHQIRRLTIGFVRFRYDKTNSRYRSNNGLCQFTF